eukprot:11656639-Ditylum_brightwellii.AAC.1
MIRHLLEEEDKYHLRKVSAQDLSNHNPPKLLDTHAHMGAKDKDIWDHSYANEYFGLHESTRTWKYI